jgi:hypothetical protein
MCFLSSQGAPGTATPRCRPGRMRDSRSSNLRKRVASREPQRQNQRCAGGLVRIRYCRRTGQSAGRVTVRRSTPTVGQVESSRPVGLLSPLMPAKAVTYMLRCRLARRPWYKQSPAEIGRIHRFVSDSWMSLLRVSRETSSDIYASGDETVEPTHFQYGSNASGW